MARYVEFVIQKHLAKKAGSHYDLRLMYPYKKSLASWALPKTRVPENPGDKVLAVRTSDHPAHWADFEGTIPAGEGGAGTVEIMQKGKAEIFIWTSKIITFKVEGSILDGKYALIKYKNSRKQTDWLLIKSKDNK